MTDHDAQLTAYIAEIRIAIAAAMRAQSLYPSNALSRVIFLMAEREGWASAKLSPVTIPPLREISPVGPRPKIPPAACAGTSGCECGVSSACAADAAVGVASAGTVPPVSAPPAAEPRKENP